MRKKLADSISRRIRRASSPPVTASHSGRAEAVEQRGPQEEGADLRGLATEHLGAEVVDDVPVVARELADELLGVGGSATPEGERGEVEACRPALGAFLEPSDGVVPQPEPVQVVQQRLRVLDREAEVRGVDLDELAPGPESRERQRGRRPRRDRELQHAGEVVDEGGDALLDLRVGDQVVVVEDQHDPVLRRGQLVAERREDVLDDVDPRRFEGGQGGRARVGVLGAQRLDEVGPEAHRVVVAAVEGQPGEAAGLGFGGVPLGQQGRLPPPGRCADHGELPRRARAEGEQPGPGHLTAVDRRLHLRRQHAPRPLPHHHAITLSAGPPLTQGEPGAG